MTNDSKRERVPATDSPWFWVLVFAVFGLGALTALQNKYSRRQANIERKYQARQRIQTAEASGQRPSKPDDARQASDAGGPLLPRNFSRPSATLIPLWPLAMLLVLLAVVAGAMLARARMAHAENGG